ncbi:MAG: hypothetical protein WDW36_004866 [Sanguina aurantia]
MMLACKRAALSLIISFAVTASAQQKGASISLTARWNGTSYSLEAAEFLAEQGQELYWAYVESVLDSRPLTASHDPEQCWNHILDQASALVSPSVAKVVPLVLASRQYSAKLEMFRQLALEANQGDLVSCCFVSLGGQLITDPAQLRSQLDRMDSSDGSKAIPEQLYQFDHVHNAVAQGSKAPAAVLYGAPGTACFAGMHHLLRASADAQQVRYAHRPLLRNICQEESAPCLRLGTQGVLQLPGYGVEAALKNMEYSAMDDKNKAAAAAAAGDAEPADGAGGPSDALGIVKGFDFDALATRKPLLRQELLTLRDQLQSANEDEVLKVWDLKDVGLQATQRILAASDPLGLLTEISQNFPSLVSSLSRQPVNASLRNAVAANQQNLSPGANFLIINGLAMDVAELDLYGLLDRLVSEGRLTDSLVAAGLPPPTVQALLAARSEEAGSVSDARLDLGNLEHVVWLNDLEKDAMYARFSPKISDILQAFPGRLRPLAKNVFTLVLVMDMASADGLAMVEIVMRMWSESYPLRFACLTASRQHAAPPFSARPAPSSWEGMDASEQLARAFLTMKHVFGGPAAYKMWNVAGQGSGPDGMSVAQLSVAFSETWAAASDSPVGARARMAARKSPADAWQMLTSGSGFASEVGMSLTESTQWAVSKGLGGFSGQPVAVMNGQVMLLESVVAGSTDQQILYKVIQEMQRVQEWVYYGKLDDDDDLLPTILSLAGSVSRWSPAILGDKNPQILDLGVLMHHPSKKVLQPLYRDSAPSSKPKVHHATHYVVADLAEPEGRALAGQAMRFLADIPASRDSRVVLVMNPLSPSSVPSLLELLVELGLKQAEAAGRQAVALYLSKLLSDVALSDRLAEGMKEVGMAEARVAISYATSSGLDGDQMLALLAVVVQAGSSAGGLKSDMPLLAFRGHHMALARALHLPPGAAAVVTNGRLLRVWEPPSPHEVTGTALATTAATHSPAAGGLLDVAAEDFQLLQLLVGKYKPGGAVARLLQAAHARGEIPGVPLGLEADSVSALGDMQMATTAALMRTKYPASKLPSTVSKQLQQMLGVLKDVGSVEVGARDEAATASGLHITAILNPLTRQAQRLSQVLHMLRSSLNPVVKLYLNPQRDLSDMPLKSFYRYALPALLPSLTTPGHWAVPLPPTATFPRLPSRRVLTINMDVPEPWLVEAVATQYDLDNLKLEDVEGRVAYAQFELEAVMLTGSCEEAGTRSQTGTRGIQLHLGLPSDPHAVDTLVMSNLEYFQLKAYPGKWLLSLAPGRSSEMYSIVSSTGIDAGSPEPGPDSEEGADAEQQQQQEQDSVAGREGLVGDVSTQVIVSSLSGKHMVLAVRKRPGFESADVLTEPKEPVEVTGSKPSAGLWGGVSSLLSGKRPLAASPPAGSLPATTTLNGYPNDVINIFTVASGHMYERLQKIMILSVIGNTQHRVKFWFIKNYMSPHHKAILPLMSAHFGFEYEFVTYKWPQWLHKQTDKQRIIWAYKILFLDVLFPLSVPRMIFLDSDQIIRADIAELYFMDIKGAPLAYTPFCDNNKEMDEFRFWKGGFWRDHLQGKPYHISALYLIDLRRFRQMAAGDNLRMVYESLSKDPNSLANLDQDLPNYAQHSIPIFSLPQSWLWCESWCGNATKEQAKTIDLCNNPKTKEPKLSAARRIVSEWPSLDEAQGNFTAQVQS